MSRSTITFALVTFLAGIGMAAPVAAADPPPKVDLGILYSVQHNDAGTYPVGWLVAVGGNVTNRVAIVGEFGGNYKQLSESGFDVTVKEHSALGGVRFASRRSSAAVPYVQVLSGIGNLGAGIEGVTVSVSAFAFQTGGGVDIRMGARAALRVQADYRFLRKDSENLDEFRFAVGVAFGFGKR